MGEIGKGTRDRNVGERHPVLDEEPARRNHAFQIIEHRRQRFGFGLVGGGKVACHAHQFGDHPVEENRRGGGKHDRVGIFVKPDRPAQRARFGRDQRLRGMLGFNIMHDRR